MKGAVLEQLSWVGLFGQTQLHSHIAIKDFANPRCRSLMSLLDYGLGIFYPPFIQAKPQCAQRSNHPLHTQIHKYTNTRR